MGYLRASTLFLLLPSFVWTATAPAATAAGANPLLSLNVPQLGNLLSGLGLGLGNVLGLGNGLGTMANGYGGYGFGNMAGLGNMLGLFHHNNNLFLNQFMMIGLVGMVILKITAIVLIVGAILTGGIIIKLVGVALALTFARLSHHDSYHYRRSHYGSPQRSDPWALKRTPDDTFLWGERSLQEYNPR